MMATNAVMAMPTPLRQRAASQFRQLSIHSGGSGLSSSDSSSSDGSSISRSRLREDEEELLRDVLRFDDDAVGSLVDNCVLEYCSWRCFLVRSSDRDLCLLLLSSSSSSEDDGALRIAGICRRDGGRRAADLPDTRRTRRAPARRV